MGCGSEGHAGCRPALLAGRALAANCKRSGHWLLGNLRFQVQGVTNGDRDGIIVRSLLTMENMEESQMTFKTWNRRSLSSAILVVGLALAGSAAAETACKSMSKSKCEGADACVWVNGYTTKKGVKVDSYCRNKSSKSSKSKSSGSSKKADSAKASDSKKKPENKEKAS
jgi:hypothetical protein